MKTVTKDMTIGDIIKNHPESVEVMLSYGLHCVGCQVQFWETLEGGCLGHGFEEKKIDELVKDINEKIESGCCSVTGNPCGCNSSCSKH